MTKEQLLADIRTNLQLLKTADELADYDSAQQICEHLMVTYRLLELKRLAEASKGVVHDSHP